MHGSFSRYSVVRRLLLFLIELLGDAVIEGLVTVVIGGPLWLIKRFFGPFHFSTDHIALAIGLVGGLGGLVMFVAYRGQPSSRGLEGAPPRCHRRRRSRRLAAVWPRDSMLSDRATTVATAGAALLALAHRKGRRSVARRSALSQIPPATSGAFSTTGNIGCASRPASA